jgi:diguanylate cyclase (GGDEF)-like protein
VALFFAEAKLRHGDPAGAVELLDPFAEGETDTTFLALFGEGLLRTGQLDRARDAFVAFYRQKQDGFTKMFELAGAYIRTGQDEKGADVLNVTKEWMKMVRRENEFAAQVDRMTTVYPNSLELARLVAALYEELNRETKYFDSLVHLFDLYFEAGMIKAACDVLDRLVDIDPYDYRNHQRIAKLQGKADPVFLKNILARAAKAASIITRPEGFGATGTRGERPGQQPEEHRAHQALDDLMVQVEIFLQYSLHAKAVERLEKIAEIFPGEEEKNERLHNLFDRAGWWPGGKKKPAPKPVQASVAPGVPAASAAAPIAGILGFDVDTQRDLSQISEFTRLMYRQATPREVVTAAAQEIGKYMNVSRCIVSVTGGKEDEPLTAEFTGPGIVPAGSAQISSIVSMLETSPPDSLGGIELSGPGIPALRELKLETVLGVRLVDKETRAPSGAVLVGSERMRQWRPNDSFFLQAVGDQILISANHTRTQAVVRTMAFADEKTGLVSRGAYVACLLAESSRARAQNTPVSLVILHVDSGGDLLRQYGDTAFEKYIEQLARSLRGAVRQTDLAVKYTAWSLAFILPDTNAGSAKMLAEKLRQTASAVQAPWNGEGLSLSAVIAEAANRPSDDNEDRVTEWINRAEVGLDEVRSKTDEKVLVLASP